MLLRGKEADGRFLVLRMKQRPAHGAFVVEAEFEATVQATMAVGVGKIREEECRFRQDGNYSHHWSILRIEMIPKEGESSGGRYEKREWYRLKSDGESFEIREKSRLVMEGEPQVEIAISRQAVLVHRVTVKELVPVGKP